MTYQQAPTDRIRRPLVALIDLASRQVRSSAVRSRLLRECYYQPETRTLAVHLRTGRWEVYDNIDETVYDQVVAHPYPGYLFECLRQTHLAPPLSILSASRAAFLYGIRRMSSAQGQTVTGAEDHALRLQ